VPICSPAFASLASRRLPRACSRCRRFARFKIESIDTGTPGRFSRGGRDRQIDAPLDWWYHHLMVEEPNPWIEKHLERERAREQQAEERAKSFLQHPPDDAGPYQVRCIRGTWGGPSLQYFSFEVLEIARQWARKARATGADVSVWARYDRQIPV
jgi:hypothetical protein